MLDGASVESLNLLREGVRIMRIEAPWHNHRRRIGRYGGEPFLATQPLAGLELFGALVREMGVLIAWCREQGSRRVAVGRSEQRRVGKACVSTSRSRWSPDL